MRSTPVSEALGSSYAAQIFPELFYFAGGSSQAGFAGVAGILRARDALRQGFEFKLGEGKTFTLV